MEIFVGQLVESWAKAFGRVVYVSDRHYEVKWSYGNLKNSFCSLDQASWFKFFNKEETAYVDVSGVGKDKHEPIRG